MAFDNPLDKIRPLEGLHPGNLGARVRLSPNESSGILKAENGSTQGEALSVTLSGSFKGRTTPRLKPDLRTALIPLPQATIRWGCGGTRQEVTIDLAVGTSISVVAESIEVSVRYCYAFPPWVEDPESLNVGCLPDLEVFGTMGYGGSARSGRFTQAAFVETPGDSVLVPIPEFAQSFTVLPLQSTLVHAHLRGYSPLFDIEDVIVAPLSNLGQSNRIDQIPIPNGAMWVEIENAETENPKPTNALVVFAIGL